MLLRVACAGADMYYYVGAGYLTHYQEKPAKSFYLIQCHILGRRLCFYKSSITLYKHSTTTTTTTKFTSQGGERVHKSTLNYSIQAPVVRRLDNANNWINRYPGDKNTNTLSAGE